MSNNMIGHNPGEKTGFVNWNIFKYQPGQSNPPRTITIDESTLLPAGYEYYPKGYILSPLTTLAATEAPRYRHFIDADGDVEQDLKLLVVLAQSCSKPLNQAVGQGHQTAAAYFYGNGGTLERGRLIFHTVPGAFAWNDFMANEIAGH